MKIFKGKSRRTVIFSIVTLLSIVILLGLNFLATYFGLYNTLFIDMTPEELFTVSDAMMKECEFIDKLGETDGDKKIKITFCTDPDFLVGTEVTRPTYLMALNLANEFENFEVETVNVQNEPTALAQYKSTSLSTIYPTDFIISYGERYRIASAINFWTTDSGSTSSAFASYNGEYRLATLMKSVTSVDQPTAYFVTNHGETYYDEKNPASEKSLASAELYDLLRDRGLKVGLIDLSVEDIPEDCAVLIINDPRVDFSTDPSQYGSLAYISETEKLDRYLVKNQGAILVARDYDNSEETGVNLPIFDDFLKEWGFEFSSSIVRGEDGGEGSDTIVSVYDPNEDTLGDAIYGDFATLGSAPKTIFKNSGYITTSYGEAGFKNEAGAYGISRTYTSLFKAPFEVFAYKRDPVTGSYLDSTIKETEIGGFDLAAATVRTSLDETTGKWEYSYLFCANSKDFFSNDLLGKASYANYDVTSSLIEHISRVDIYASMDVGGTSPNSQSYGGKILVDLELLTEDITFYEKDENGKVEYSKTNHAFSTGAAVAYTVVLSVLPIAALTLGIVVCVKRRFL